MDRQFSGRDRRRRFPAHCQPFQRINSQRRPQNSVTFPRPSPLEFGRLTEEPFQGTQNVHDTIALVDGEIGEQQEHK